jgi:hypothetical protein
VRRSSTCRRQDCSTCLIAPRSCAQAWVLGGRRLGPGVSESHGRLEDYGRSVRWTWTILLGLALGAATAAVDVVAGGFDQTPAWRAVAMLLNAGCVWAGLAVLSGWILGTPWRGALVGAIAALVVPVGAAVEMLVIRSLGPQTFRVDPWQAWTQVAVLVVAAGGAVVAVRRASSPRLPSGR